MVLNCCTYLRFHPLHPKYLHDLVPQVVDDLHGDAARVRFRKGTAGVAVERGPCVSVDLGLERCFEGRVRIVLSQKVGVPDEKALLVVVGVDEPTGNTIRPVASDFTGIGVEYVDPVDSDLCVVASG